MSKPNNNTWWGPPRNFSNQFDERKISWLELFYDLVYVAVIAQLTDHLAKHPGPWEFSYFFLFFLPVFWSWMNGSYYYDLHGNQGIRTRFFTLLQMLAVASVAITLGDAFEGHHQSFAISFAIVQTIITYLWWSTGIYDISHRSLSKYYVINYSIGLICFVISIFTTREIAIGLWVFALIANYSVGIIAAPSSIREFNERGVEVTASSSMIERFGLFIIIVIGEAILGIVHGISEIDEKSMSVWMTFILGIFITFLLWWIYFELVSDRKTKIGYQNMQLLNFLHIPLVSAFAIAGSSIRVILSENELHPNEDIRWIFGAAICMILFVIICLTEIMQPDKAPVALVKKVSWLSFISGASTVVVSLLSSHFNTIIFLALIAFILILPIIFGTRHRVYYKLFDEK
jgi:low temperature requirement protein LtrA